MQGGGISEALGNERTRQGGGDGARNEDDVGENRVGGIHKEGEGVEATWKVSDKDGGTDTVSTLFAHLKVIPGDHVFLLNNACVPSSLKLTW